MTFPFPVLVPCTKLSAGLGWAEVRDDRSGKPVRVRDADTVLVGRVVHVRGHSLGVEDGLHRVRFATASAWCREVVADGPAGTGAAA